MAKRQYIIYSDESDRKGRLFSNFFGGALLLARDREAISDVLDAKKSELNLFSELKWQKVTEAYLEKYVEFVDTYFDFVETGRIKIRVMFTQNIYRPIGLTKEQEDSEYFRLYYQFIKHAFGIKYCNPNNLDKIYFSLLPDQIPDTAEKVNKFKDFASKIPHTKDMAAYNVFIPRDQIVDVDSKNHVILQGLDIILGSMSTKLNEKFKEKPYGQRRRGKRTIAKERLYRHINGRVRQIYKNFNIGVSTGQPNGPIDRWDHPYRHWLFKPKSFATDPKRAAPPNPT